MYTTELNSVTGIRNESSVFSAWKALVQIKVKFLYIVWVFFLFSLIKFNYYLNVDNLFLKLAFSLWIKTRFGFVFHVFGLRVILVHPFYLNPFVKHF